MSLQSRLEAFAAAVGADIKALQASSGGGVTGYEPHYPFVRVDTPTYFPVNGAVNSVTTTQSRLYFLPVVIPTTRRASILGMEVLTSVASTTCRMGLYNSLSDGRPGTLIVEAPSAIATTSTGVKTVTLTTPVTMNARTLYFIGMVAQGGVPAFRGRGSSDPYVSDPSATPSFAIMSTYYQTGVTGALPATAASPPNGAMNGPAAYIQFIT